jgi:hypothetical protein
MNVMNSEIEEFLDSPVTAIQTRPLRALWYAAHGDWTAAHEEAQVSEDPESCWVHALLHREEGEQGNAEYWYRKAGKPVFKGSIEDEREAMITALLLPRT